MRFILILLSFLCWNLAASAATSPVQKLDLLSAIIHNPDNPDEFIAGLDLQLQKGWKTYWRAPGIAGQAMQIDATHSDNLAALDILWPFPKRFLVQDVYTNGYEGNIIFPLKIKARDSRKPIRLRLMIDLIVCDDLCIPIQKEIIQTIPPASIRSDDKTLRAALVMLPQTDDATLVKINRTGLEKNGSNWRVFVEGRWHGALEHPNIFIDTNAPLDLQMPEWRIKNNQFSVFLPISSFSSEPSPLLSKDWYIVIGNEERSAEYKLYPESAPRMAVNFFFFLLLAFAGGLILNVMPCVLPVLALKFLTVTHHAGAEHTTVRAGFFLTALGILASFLVLALLIVALKMLGHSVGWGLQFQQPIFLIAMIVLLLLFAANLAGVFEMNFLQRVIVNLPVGAFPKSLKNFGDGVFAAVLATPCTAPLLGTAAGFALAGSAQSILAIFLTIGLGFAFPYLCVALIPHSIAWLPRPGRWMIYVKKFLSLCLIGTALWLGMILISGTRTPESIWQTFNEQTLAHEVQAGRTVLVDITADWCLTCKVNELTVLNRKKTQQFLIANNVILMRADWTRKDNAIAEYLKRMERAGIPFNAVYGPSAPQGIVLNELLTFNALKESVEQSNQPKITVP